ncbi:hypothetical protein GBA52_028487 [Prunus armeniaca]|nr:hypothetical protein GBA52_028487 [Prunus armeniaca]
MEGSLTFKLGEEELEPRMRSHIILRPKQNRGTNEEKKKGNRVQKLEKKKKISAKMGKQNQQRS